MLCGGGHGRPHWDSEAITHCWGLDSRGTGKPSKGFEERLVRLGLVFHKDHSGSCVVDCWEARGETDGRLDEENDPREGKGFS